MSGPLPELGLTGTPVPEVAAEIVRPIEGSAAATGVSKLSEQCVRCERWVRPGTGGYCLYHHMTPAEVGQ